MLLPDYSNHVEAFLKEFFLFYDTTYVEKPGNPYHRGRISTVDLLAQVSSDQHLFILKTILFFTKQPILTRRSSVLIVPLHSNVLSRPCQLGFLALSIRLVGILWGFPGLDMLKVLKLIFLI
jgi:hypothetical protein